jgi:DNA-binding Lrp family transcriptional regulator
VSNDFTQEELEFYRGLAASGAHAFVFVDHVPDPTQLGPVMAELDATIPGNEDELNEQLGTNGAVVLSASEFIGPFKAFIHLWASEGDLTGIEKYIATQLWPRGIGCETNLQGSAHKGADGQVYLLKIKHCDVVAVVRIWLEKGADPEKVMGLLEDLPGFQGAATILGGFDVLLVLEAEDLQTVADVALGELQHIPGVARTETELSDYCWPRDEEEE